MYVYPSDLHVSGYVSDWTVSLDVPSVDVHCIYQITLTYIQL
jgi:hypothetical protein